MKYTDRSVYSRSREYPFKRPAGKGACMSVQPDPDLEPPVALVTEATSGIGRAIALKLASDGHYVIVHGRDAQRGKETVEEIESNGGRGRFVPAVLTAPGDIARLAADAGAVDVLVNNAGFSWFGPTANLDVATFDSLFASNVRSAYFLVAAIAPSWPSAAPAASSTWQARPGRSAWLEERPAGRPRRPSLRRLVLRP